MEIDIANYRDVIARDEGRVSGEDVRTVRLSGLVDTGATRLVLPQSAVDALGLSSAGTVTVQYADGRRAPRPVVRDVEVAIQGRSGVFTAVVEAGRREALLGAIVLEELDFVVDCTRQQVVPREPDTVLVEIE